MKPISTLGFVGLGVIGEPFLRDPAFDADSP